ncbi:MAG: hypothetical protein V4608_14770 [Bacteroidota bacterium]
MAYQYIEDEIGSIVEVVSVKMLTELQAIDPAITGVHYEFGTVLEIIETLTQKTESNEWRYKKYPLVCLFVDIKEPIGEVGDYSDLKLNMAIVYGTNADFKAKQRLELNFKRVIMPIYHAFLDELSLRGNAFIGIGPAERIKHTAIRHYYWGRNTISGNEANKLGDFVDGLGIENLELRYYLNRC